MLPEKVETKTIPSRRMKYFIVGLFAIIFVLSYHLYKVHREKKEVARRKGYFIQKYRDSKKLSEKLTTEVKMKTSTVTSLRKQLGNTMQERDVSIAKIDKLNEENENLRENVEKLDELAVSRHQPRCRN